MSDQSKKVYGIDLGTTNSCIARYHDGHFEVLKIDDQPTVPSVVAFDGSSWLVGRSARNYGKVAPAAAVSSIKRHMGDPHYKVNLHGEDYSPVAISAKILRYLKDRTAELYQENVEDVVITVPAWFNNQQRQDTIAAGVAAGLHVLRIVNEPTAAALAYEASTIHGATEGTLQKQNWLVYDLGGGTFDVSIVAVDGEYKEVLASCGNTFLGGDDFDQMIASFMVNHLKSRYSVDVSDDKVVMATLKYTAEEAKIALSTETEVTIREVVAFGGQKLDLELALTRDKFQAMIQDLIDSTMSKVDQVVDDARISIAAIDHLILVGGSTRIPMIAEQLEKRLKLTPCLYVDPDLSVALGASVQAALAASLTFAKIVVDVSPHSLGIAALGDQDFLMGRFETMAYEGPTTPLTFVPIIKRNSRLPARFTRQFQSMIDNQEKLQIEVFQGESALTTDNHFIGSFWVDLLPDRPAGSPIDVGFNYDLNGIIKVRVCDGVNKQELKGQMLDIHRPAARAISDRLLDEEHDDTGIFLDKNDDGIMNMLVEKVEDKLRRNAGASGDVIKEKLTLYRKLLSDGNDREIDRIEGELYDWLDDEKESL